MNFEKRPYLDSLRGLAALIVVMCHYAGAFYPFAIFNTHGLDGDSGRYKQMSIFDSLFHQTPLGLFVAGHFAVCLFFILSGYVLSYKFVQIKPDRNEVLGAVIKRPIRLGGTVVFTIALSYLCMRISGYQNHRVAQFTNSVPWFESFWESTPALRTFLADVILRPFQAGAKYNPPLWTIAMELYGSFLVYFYLLLFGNHKYRAIGIMTLMLYFWNTLYVGFLFGIIFAEIENWMKSKNIGHKILLLSASLIIGLLLGGYPHYSGALSSDSVYSLLPTMLPNLLGGGYSMLGAVFVFVSALHFEQIKRILNWKILRYFGSISYMIYALHFIVLGSFSSYLYLFLFDRGWHHHSASIITLLVSLPIIFVLAYVGTKLVDEKALYLASKIGRLAQANMINFQNRNK